jgi:phosphoglycolate phosphatase
MQRQDAGIDPGPAQSGPGAADATVLDTIARQDRHRMGFRLAIFDFDGTLADSFEWFVARMNLAAREHGFRSLDPDRLDDYRGMQPRRLMAELGVPAWKLPILAASMRRAMRDDIAAIRLFPGVAGLLAELRRTGVATAVVSSNSRANVARVLGPAAADITHFGCGVSLFGKRSVFVRLCAVAGVPRREAVAIGDELRDAEAAAAAGIGFVGVGWGFAAPGVLTPHSLWPPPEDVTALAARLRGAIL